MKNFRLVETELRAGYQMEVRTLDYDKSSMSADISFEVRFNKFYIWFNGKLIHTCKTFQSVINRLNKLDIKFPLDDYSYIM